MVSERCACSRTCQRHSVFSHTSSTNAFLCSCVGEIPSKLETLTSMASELAMSAVHNGRFHHATASLALEEQLASRHCPVDQRFGSQPLCKFPTPFKARPVVRSASSSVFSQVASLGGESAFTDELSRVNSAFSGDFYDSQTSNNNSSCPPGMVQSSQSDSCDDNDAESFASEPEDCAAGEWAAALVAVADQSMDKENAALLFGQRDRSISESSDSSSGSDSSSDTSSNDLSKSPVGFWYVRPGSSSVDDASEDDDEQICWTPSLQSSSHQNAMDPLLLNDDKSCPPHILSPSGFSASNLSKLLTEAADESSHPSNQADDELGPITPPTDQLQNPPTVGCLSSFKPMKKLSRSISYSAFSTYSNTPSSMDPKPKLFQSTAMRNGLPSTQETDLFRTYFMKFVDLLVVRETERLVHGKELKA